MRKMLINIKVAHLRPSAAWLSRDLIRAAHQQITQEWWKNRRDDFDLFISEFVINEAASGDSRAAEMRLKAVCEESGYKCPKICTPEELLGGMI